tara:strand:- start:1058 stop:1270 length:213 start_codon:yes stop_codon:yes gene_type:complete
MIYHGFKRKEEHTVIPGIIRWVHIEGNKYHIEYFRMIKRRFNAGSDFDDIGKRKQAEQYHYNQKTNKGDL